jgi:hypothetical protein
MTGMTTNGQEGSNHPLKDLPAAAIQAIYHHATGKTESMSHDLSNNVIVSAEDIDNLHRMVLDQLGVHSVAFGPTVTVVVKQANSRTLTHSSWEHFKSLFTISNEVTSEVTLRYEFLVEIQQAIGPQRCVITVNLDSALPLLEHKERNADAPFSYWMWISREWETAKVTIDFVDFMVARGFLNVIEEWFKGLKPSPKPILGGALIKKFAAFENASLQAGRVGFAIFLAVFVYLRGSSLTLSTTVYATCVGLVLWSVFHGIIPAVSRWIFGRVTANIVPSVILLNKKDTDVFNTICGELTSTKVTIFSMMMTILFNISLNIVASYLFEVFIK